MQGREGTDVRSEGDMSSAYRVSATPTGRHGAIMLSTYGWFYLPKCVPAVQTGLIPGWLDQYANKTKPIKLHSSHNVFCTHLHHVLKCVFLYLVNISGYRLHDNATINGACLSQKLIQTLKIIVIKESVPLPSDGNSDSTK